MFPADMTEQRRKLIATLAFAVNGLANLQSVLPAASALAKRHIAYGAKPEHYPVVGAALLWTLEKGLGDAWTAEAAWAAAYGALSSLMIEQAYGRHTPPNARDDRLWHITAIIGRMADGRIMHGQSAWRRQRDLARCLLSIGMDRPGLTSAGLWRGRSWRHAGQGLRQDIPEAL